jgi:hypothetical protein
MQSMVSAFIQLPSTYLQGTYIRGVPNPIVFTTRGGWFPLSTPSGHGGDKGILWLVWLVFGFHQGDFHTLESHWVA